MSQPGTLTPPMREAVNQLVRFGRRPWVHINVTDDTAPALLAYARRIADHYRRGGLDVSVRYHTYHYSVTQAKYYKESYADYNVIITCQDMDLDRVWLVRGQHKVALGLDRSRHHVFVQWPSNALKNTERIYHLTPAQLDWAMERYTGCRQLLVRLAGIRRNDASSRAVYAEALSAHERLLSLVGVTKSFELSEGHEYRANMPLNLATDEGVTIAAHLQYRLSSTLLNALERVAPLMADEARVGRLVRLTKPAMPEDKPPTAPPVTTRTWATQTPAQKWMAPLTTTQTWAPAPVHVDKVDGGDAPSEVGADKENGKQKGILRVISGLSRRVGNTGIYCLF